MQVPKHPEDRERKSKGLIAGSKGGRGSKTDLAERLRAEAIANAERDLAIAAEWFPLEEEAARTFEAPATSRKLGKPRRIAARRNIKKKRHP
jgi:hypothetical protein